MVFRLAQLKTKALACPNPTFCFFWFSHGPKGATQGNRIGRTPCAIGDGLLRRPPAKTFRKKGSTQRVLRVSLHFPIAFWAHLKGPSMTFLLVGSSLKRK